MLSVGACSTTRYLRGRRRAAGPRLSRPVGVVYGEEEGGEYVDNHGAGVMAPGWPPGGQNSSAVTAMSALFHALSLEFKDLRRGSQAAERPELADVQPGTGRVDRRNLAPSASQQMFGSLP